MNNMYKWVKEWMSMFKVPMNNTLGTVSKDRYQLRYDLMKEENEEYLEACENGDLVEILDAIIDQQFILFGTAHEHSVPEDLYFLVFKEVTNSNFSKAENGKPIFREDGKILKGKNYFKPNIKKIVDEYMENKKQGV